MVKINSLLQRDYGKAQDCTLVSILTILQKDIQLTSPESTYGLIESIAYGYRYNGDKWGTIPFFIKKIMEDVYSVLNIKHKCHVRYGKGVAFNFNTVKNLTDRGVPVILSLFSDGVGKYRNHSVVVIDCDATTKDFIIYDNWAKEPQRLSYKKLCAVACINWAN